MENHQWKLRWEGLGTSGKRGRIEAVPEWVSGGSVCLWPYAQPAPPAKKSCFISRGGRRCSQNRVGDLKLKSTELDIPSPVLQQARASAKERILKAKV